jgi:excisionase family DNA binding protein
MGTDGIKPIKYQVVKKGQRISSPTLGGKEPVKPRLLTVKETSVYLGRSVPSIRELIWSGDLPIVRVGRRIHLDLFDLEKWIEQHKTKYTD